MTNQETTARSNKTIFINAGEKAAVYDYNKNEAHQLKNVTTSIDWMYVAPEDCEVRVKDKNTNKTIVYKANKDDIILQFYNNATTKNICAVIKNKEWRENIIETRIAAETQKLKDCACCENSGCIGESKDWF